MTNDSPINARFAPNGDPFTAITLLDVNSMYLDSQMKFMPLSPGLRWIKMPGNYYKKVHLSYGTSFKSLQWLYWIEHQLQMNGHQEQLQHLYHRGEKRVCGYKVDGYTVIDGEEVIYEFYGNMDLSNHFYSSFRVLDARL